MAEYRRWSHKFPDSNLKSEMRTKLLRHIHDEINGKKFVDAFTLPASNLIFEEMLCEEFGKKLSVISVEHDKEIFKRAKQVIEIKNLPVKIHHCEDTEFWSTNKKEFDIIWLDYCGPWSPKKHKVMEDIARGEHVKQSKNRTPIIALTIQEGMDFLKIDELLLVAKELKIKGNKGQALFKARLAGIPHLLNQAANDAGNTILPIHIYRYKDKLRNKCSNPMIMFAFKLEKGVHDYDIFSSPITRLESDYLSGMSK